MSIIRELSSKDELFEIGKFDSKSIFVGEMDIYICIDDGATLEYAEKCVESYNNIEADGDLYKQIEDSLAKFFLFMYEEWSDETIIELRLDVIKKDYDVRGKLIEYLSRPRLYVSKASTNEIGYEIECDCPWEPEHQCQIIIREDKLLYVGPSEGNSAWDDEDEFYCIWDDED